jgi:hypothetical protein
MRPKASPQFFAFIAARWRFVVPALRRPARKQRLITVSLLVVVTLTACADNSADEQRRFATDPTFTPHPEQAAASSTGVATATAPATPVLASPATPVDLATLLTDPVAPALAAFVANQQLVAVQPGQQLTTLLSLEETDILALSVTASGTAAAVLVTDEAPGGATPFVATPTSAEWRSTMRLVVVGTDGSPRWRIDDLPAALAAQEEIAPGLMPTDVALSPDATQVLLGLSDGHLLLATAEGLSVVPGSGGLGPITDIAWSPDGSGIAILATPKAPEQQVLIYSRIRPDGIDPVQLAPDNNVTDRSVAAFAWLPNSSGILYVDAAPTLTNESLALGRDLFLVQLDEPHRRLIAAAGTAAPVAGIWTFAPSPDGEAVAFTVIVPGPNGPMLDSLWVQPLAGGMPYEIPVPVGTTATDLRWTNQGLIWRMIPADSPVTAPDPSTLGIALANDDGSTTVLAELGLATPAPATPAGTPAAATPAP